MPNRNKIYFNLILTLFIFQVIIDWLYVLWVKNQSDIVVNAWFALIPVFGFFYFAFALLSLLGLYYRLRQALGLALTVILFGTICAVISYELAYKIHYLIDLTIVPLIIINAGTLIFLISNRNYFKSE